MCENQAWLHPFSTAVYNLKKNKNVLKEKMEDLYSKIQTVNFMISLHIYSNRIQYIQFQNCKSCKSEKKKNLA